MLYLLAGFTGGSICAVGHGSVRHGIVRHGTMVILRTNDLSNKMVKKHPKLINTAKTTWRYAALKNNKNSHSHSLSSASQSTLKQTLSSRGRLLLQFIDIRSEGRVILDRSNASMRNCCKESSGCWRRCLCLYLWAFFLHLLCIHAGTAFILCMPSSGAVSAALLWVVYGAGRLGTSLIPSLMIGLTTVVLLPMLSLILLVLTAGFGISSADKCFCAFAAFGYKSLGLLALA